MGSGDSGVKGKIPRFKKGDKVNVSAIRGRGDGRVWEVTPSELWGHATRILWQTLASLGLDPGDGAASTCIPKLYTEEVSSSCDSIATKLPWPGEGP